VNVLLDGIFGDHCNTGIFADDWPFYHESFGWINLFIDDVWNHQNYQGYV
jgi:hypothetical protein